MDDNKLTGTVLAVSGNKTLVLVKGNEYYLLRNRVNDHINDTVEFRAADALPMPSYLFAIAALEEPDQVVRRLEKLKRVSSPCHHPV